LIAEAYENADELKLKQPKKPNQNDVSERVSCTIEAEIMKGIKLNDVDLGG
jgi:hypothetical protein